MSNDGEAVNEPTHKVSREGVEKYRGGENDCWVYVLKHQGMSVDWAVRYEGWAIEPLEGSVSR